MPSWTWAGTESTSICEAVTGALDQLDASIDELHDVAVGLRADIVTELDPAEALQWYVEKTAAAHGVRATIRSSGTTEAPIEVRAHLFRVLQEALANALKHGKAREVVVELARKEHQVELTVRDNGAGFDPDDSASPKTGIGLTSMNERAELLGGSLAIRSAPGRGCEVRFLAPLERAGAEAVGETISD